MTTDTIPCTTVGDLVSMAQEHLNRAGIENARQEAELFVSHTCGVRRLDVYLNRRMHVSDTIYARLKHMLQQRCTGVPTAYILGSHEFMGIPLFVDRRVLIPRPETECLVENVLEVVKSYKSRTGKLSILDIGAGSGAIAVALAMNIPHAAIIAVDISMPALDVARHNSMRHNLQHAISFFQADSVTCFKATKNTVDIIISNPPYVKTGDISRLQREIQYEPRIALDGGVDGTLVLDHIVRQSRSLLRSGGYCALEIDPSQVNHVRQSLMDEGYTDISVRKDYGGCDRIVIARNTN